MKRKLITGAVLFAAFILATVGVLALLPEKELGQELKSFPVEDMDKELELHFEGYHIKLISWDKQEIKVEESQRHMDLSGENTKLSFTENSLAVTPTDESIKSSAKPENISLFCSQTWLSLMQFEKYFDYSKEVWDQTYADFFIFVPEEIKVNVYCAGVINPPSNIGTTYNWSGE